MIELKEGATSFKIPTEDSYLSSKADVFYNPHMAINRDFTILILEAYSILKSKKLIIADPMCASGIRVLRLLKETNVVEKAYINDINKKAIDVARENLRDYQNVYYFNEDANLFLLQKKGFDYIDIDPFGSPVEFLDMAIKSLRYGGLVGITATDTASLSGAYPFKAIRRYGSKPLESEFYHETALRILIKSIIETAFKFDIALIPVFAFSYRHFLRAFFVKEKTIAKSIELYKEFGYIGYCHNCKFRKGYTCVMDLPKYCPCCGDFFDYGGLLFMGPIYDKHLIDIMKDSKTLKFFSKDAKKLFDIIKEEAHIKSPWFYKANIFGKPTMPKLQYILKKLKATKTHFSPEGFKTDMDFKDIKEFFEKWG